MFRSDISIKTKTVLLLTVTLFVLGGIFAYITTESVRFDWVQSEMEENYNLAETEAKNISLWINDEARVVSHVVDSVGFTAQSLDATKLELRTVTELLSRGRSQPGIMAISEKGRVFYRDNMTEWDKNALSRVTSVSDSLFRSEAAGIAVMPYYVHPFNTSFLFVVPKRSATGKLLGTFNILVKYSDLHFESTSSLLVRTSGWHILSADSLNVYRIHPARARLLWGLFDRNSPEFRSADGGYFVSVDGIACSYVRIPDTDRYVVILDDVPGFSTALKNLEQLHIGFGMIALLLILTSSVYVSRTLIRPLRALRKGVEELKNDSFSEVDTAASGEIEELLESFNQMGRRMQSSRKELKALNDFSTSLVTDVRDEDVYRKVAKAVADAFDVEGVIVSMEEDGTLVPKATIGIEDDMVDGLRIRVGEGLLGTIFQGGQGLLSNNLSSDLRVHNKTLVKDRHLEKFAGVPLSVQDKSIGVLAILNPKDYREFGKSDLYLLNTFAGQAAIKIRNHALYEELENDMERIQELQAGLVHSEKLAAVGQLVSGVAHELNNPLGIILGYANLASKRTSDPVLTDNIKKIENAAERASSIVRNLLVFSRKREVSQDAVSINEVLRSVCELVHSQLTSNNITLRLNMTEPLPATAGDFQQLQQVFLNLVTNAIHAIEGKGHGKLVITTFPEASSLIVTVADDGVGISPENLPRVFEPFFTTKPVGKGTGLGLSLCYGIIRQHGGDITVQSLYGKGTVFTVEIPVREVSPPGDPVTVRGIIEKMSSCRVLVVEDEPAMLSLLHDSLIEFGCAVTTAANGEEALGILGKAEVDVIVSDLKMPEMDGETFYKACIVKHPGYRGKFIFSSGDTASKHSSDFLRDTGCEVLLKPYSTDQLLDAIYFVKGRSDRVSREVGEA